MSDHSIGCIQNGLCGTVILLQANDPASLVLLFKIQDILYRGAAEAVNTLIIIANNTDIFIPSGQKAGQQILHMVCILILVHQNIPEFTLIIGAYVFVLLQQSDCNINNIIKVQRIVFLQFFLISDIGFRNMQGTKITGAFCPFQHGLGRNHIVLFLADGTQDISWRECLIIQSHILDNILDNTLRIRRIINRKAAGISHPLNIPPQNPAAGRMESHSPNILRSRTQQNRQTFLQLIGSLIGEGNGHDAPGNCRFHSTQSIRSPSIFFRKILWQRFQEANILFSHRIQNFPAVTAAAKPHDICDPIYKDCCLTAAGAGQKQQRTLSGQHCFPLHAVQLCKITGNVRFTGR